MDGETELLSYSDHPARNGRDKKRELNDLCRALGTGIIGPEKKNAAVRKGGIVCSSGYRLILPATVLQQHFSACSDHLFRAYLLCI